MIAFASALLWPGPVFAGIWGGAVWQGSGAADRMAADQSAIREDHEAAESLYQTIHSMNLSAPGAAQELKSYGMKSGQVQLALRDYERQKRDEYFKELSEQGTSLLDKLRQDGTSVQYILSALSKGGPIGILQSYFFAFLLDSQGFAQEANYYFNKAEFMKQLVKSRRLSELVRPMQYELPRIYEQLGRPRSSIYEIQIVPFPDDEMLKAVGYLSDNDLDKSGTRLDAGGFVGYDSNVIELADVDDLPQNVGEGMGANQVVVAELGAQTRPASLLQAGVDGMVFVNHHVRYDERLQDAWTIAPSAFLSVWNGANNELRLRYDYLYTLKQQQSPHVFSRIQGPQLGWTHAWNKRYQAELLYNYTGYQYANDQTDVNQQNGREHVLTAKFSYPSANRQIQPFAIYRFAHRWPKGSDFQSNSHALQIGTDYFITSSLVLNIATEAGVALYPNNEYNRFDHYQSVRATGMYRLFDALTFSLDASYISNTSTASSLFSYDRWTIMAGVIVGGWL